MEFSMVFMHRFFTEHTNMHTMRGVYSKKDVGIIFMKSKGINLSRRYLFNICQNRMLLY